jgi:hypothetical protein
MFFANTKALTLEDDDDFINNLVEDFNESINILFFFGGDDKWTILHHYQLSCNFNSLMSKEVGDWVTWYFNFLMM